MESKLYVNSFLPTINCELAIREQIAFATASYMTAKNWSISQRQLAEQTGLHRDTISDIVVDLKSRKLLNAESLRAIKPPDGWFVKSKKSAFAYWRFYVPAKDLEFTDAAFYSYILHCLKTGYVPKYGFSCRHFEDIFKTSKDTFTRSLDRLDRHSLIVDDVVNVDLSPEQLNLFADIPAKVHREHKGRVFKLGAIKSKTVLEPVPITDEPLEISPEASAVLGLYRGLATDVDRKKAADFVKYLQAEDIDVGKLVRKANWKRELINHDDTFPVVIEKLTKFSQDLLNLA